MKDRLPLVLLLLSLAAAPASGQSGAVRPERVVSPEVLLDGRVVFRLRAPRASEVIVAGDFGREEGHTETLTKDDEGVWSVVTEPLSPDYYTYHFIVDGVTMPDPVNGVSRPGVPSTQSALLVSGPESAFLEAAPVPHGRVQIVFYQSAVTGSPRRMHVYVPPGYEDGKTRYPVFYLLHGGGEDDRAWVMAGRINFILDNLIAQGRATPMVVVMPNLWTLDPLRAAGRRDEIRELFRKDLLEEVIPYVEEHYRLLAGPDSRAFGGNGAGREMLPNLVWSTLGRFSYIFQDSGGVNPEWMPLFEERYPDVLDDPDNIKRVKFFIGTGTNDHSNPAAKNLEKELKQRGYDTIYFEEEGTHRWPSFRRYLAEFVQVAFRWEQGVHPKSTPSGNDGLPAGTEQR